MLSNDKEDQIVSHELSDLSLRGVWRVWKNVQYAKGRNIKYSQTQKYAKFEFIKVILMTYPIMNKFFIYSTVFNKDGRVLFFIHNLFFIKFSFANH